MKQQPTKMTNLTTGSHCV